MNSRSPEQVKAALHKFCSERSSTFIPMEPLSDPLEIVPDTVFQFTVQHRRYQRCVARLYMGLDNHLGGRMWQQEAQSLLRLSARRHPALPQVREGLFRDQDGVGVLVSETSGEILTRDDVAGFRKNPNATFRQFILVADAVRTLHAQGLIHRDIWRGSFELVYPDNQLPAALTNIRLFGFEMSAFVAALADPTWRTLPNEKQKLQQYWEHGGDERLLYRAPEAVASENESSGLDLTYRSDIFSLGIVAFHWFIGDLPGELRADRSQDASGKFVAIVDRMISDQKNIAAPLKDLLRKMIKLDPRSRPTASEASTVCGAPLRTSTEVSKTAKPLAITRTLYVPGARPLMV